MPTNADGDWTYPAIPYQQLWEEENGVPVYIESAGLYHEYVWLFMGDRGPVGKKDWDDDSGPWVILSMDELRSLMAKASHLL